MKKFFGLWMMAFVLCLFSCKNTDPVRIYENTAAQDAVGVYTGVWESVSSSTGNVTKYDDGIITLEVFKDSLANQCFVYIKSEQANWDFRGLTNVAHAGDDIVFQNESSGNGIGQAIYGRISNQKLTMAFSSFGKEGRKSVIFSNTFNGEKQE